MVLFAPVLLGSIVCASSRLPRSGLYSADKSLFSTVDTKLFKFKRGGSTVVSANEKAHLHDKSILVNAHAMSVDECLTSLNVEERLGLSAAVANSRLEIYGPNALTAPPEKSLFRLIIEQFDSKLVQILVGVAALSGILAIFEKELNAFFEPAVIITILVLNAFVGIWQTKSAESSLEALRKLQPENSCVLRDGVWINEFPASNIVPGDIVYVRVGDKVPADGRVIGLKTTSFSTDESSLTGESLTVSKNTGVVDVDSSIPFKTNMVFSGSMVTNGAAFILITKTGMFTEIGQINAGVQEAKLDEMKTPLALKLDEFGDQLTKLIGGICVLVWVMSIPKFSSPAFASKVKGAIYYAKVAVALGVAAIPEGLPAVITLCLSLGTRRMAKRNVIVRKLSSVETLGCTSVICTDKTGTLTTNQMVVTSLVTLSAAEERQVRVIERPVSGVSYEPTGEVMGLATESMHQTGLQRLAEVCSVCNEADVIFRDGVFERVGEPTEAALRVLVEKLGVADVARSTDPTLMAQQANKHWERQVEKLAVLEFNRDRKSMSVLCRLVGEGSRGSNRLLVKGAAEVLLARCNRVILEDGRIVALDAELRKRVRGCIAEMAQRPLRCLALAYKEGDELGDLQNLKSAAEASDSPLLRDPSHFETLESGLVLAGICGIKDPARPEAAEAISKCRLAGVRVMMMTGDSRETAVAIARDVNIFETNEDVSNSAFTGKEFFSLSEERQLELLRTGNKVFCRTEPRDKQRLISMLTRLGEICAMTGDGVNDAPALQQAAIGVAMGITGTEVAKNAADMVLADDNFATIVSAVEEGRCIYGNMQSFICFLISSNIGEVCVVLLATLLGIPEPLTPLHLLWVNLVTDGPPATALGFNPPDPEAMQKPPRGRDESILSRWLLTRYMITGLYVGLATIGSFTWWYLDKGVSLYQLMRWSECSVLKSIPLSSFAMQEGQFCALIKSAIGRSVPQTMALSTLVVMEMLKALSAVSLDASMFKLPFWRNRWLLLGVTIPSILHLLLLHTPMLASVFGLSVLTRREWMMVLKFSLPILLLEEILKVVGRGINRRQRNKAFGIDKL